MKITFQGFQLIAGDGMGLKDFADILVKESSATREHQFADHARLFLFEETSDKDFYTGLLITAKDQKTFPELRKKDGKLTIKISELAAGARLMDFNFFVVNKKTFCGIYQQYHASCSPIRFGVFLRYYFWNPERKARIAAKIAQLTKSGKSAEKAGKIAKATFKRSLKFALFYKPEDYAAILKTMSSIKRFQFDISTVTAQQSVFSPTIDLKRVQESVSFAKPESVKDITDAISGFVKKKKIGKGSVLALDADGEYQTIHLTQNIEGFGEFDFDETTSKLETDVEDFAKSPVIKNLLATARANKSLFL